MWNTFGGRRFPVETNMQCFQCGHTISLNKTCLRVYLRCGSCGAEYPLEDYIQYMDETLERYLEQFYCDRI